MDSGPVHIPEPKDFALSAQQKVQKQRMLKVLEALEAGHSRKSAASMAGVSPVTVREWTRRGRSVIPHILYSWFYNEIQRSEGSGESLFADIVIREASENHNWRAAMFVLQKRYGWGSGQNMDEDVQLQQQQAHLSKTKADIVYVEMKTTKMKESTDGAVFARLRDILEEVRDEVRTDAKGESVN